MQERKAMAPLPDMQAVTEIARRFDTAKAADPALENAELGELLRLVPGRRALAEGLLDGRDAVFRFHLGGPPAAQAREWAELQRIWPLMRDGACRVVEPLHFNGDHGVMVVSRVSGTPLLQHLWKIDPARRAAILGPAARWLRQYTEVSEVWRPAKPGAWLSRAERASAKQPFRRLARIEAGILNELHRLARLMGKADWRCAIGHGDFHPNNLILRGERLTGIDTGGSAVMPVYKDMARFLVHMGRRGMIPSGRSYLGVDADGIAAFGDVFSLSRSETGLHLPFMIGCETLLRVETRKLKRGRIRHAEAMSQALLRDLREAGRDF
ncbi:phosphotransferase [Roseovarius sp. SYSU LYC5161]|uniref:phosphotransferase n=1 Tax=Roseovarius halophilus (ex Wu et al. 2025) TaxID=3376060 RepID=UPI00399BDACB